MVEAQLDHWKKQHDIELLTADGLAAQVADVRGALEKASGALRWIGRTSLAEKCEAAIARTPQQSLAKCKADALRGMGKYLRSVSGDCKEEGHHQYDLWQGLLSAAEDCDAMAARLEQEAAHGR